MNCVYITAIICATIVALAWMFYDLRRRRIAAADKRADDRKGGFRRGSGLQPRRHRSGSGGTSGETEEQGKL